jgi:sterol desaturase/sphingolipid hydroxylase (fatty acid hydroxylase superfamily)
MTGWLLEHQAAVQFYVWLGAFGLVALWESFGPRRALGTPTAARWSGNMALAASDAVVARLCLPVSAVAVAAWADQQSWGLLKQLSVPHWAAFAVGVAAMDLANYGAHRLLHAVPLLWRCHKIHHSDLDFDCSTALRHHPIEYLVVAGTMLASIVLIGAPPVAVMTAATLDLVAAVFNHGNIALPAAIDRVLRRFVVTPDMHRIHHSVLMAEGNRNFGNVFPWWDRVFATYQAAPKIDHKRMELGLPEARAPEDVTLLKLLALPFRSARRIASA